MPFFTLKPTRTFSRAQHQLKNSLLFLLIVLIIGTVGFRLIEDYSLLDAVYMTIISVSTTGFKEVHPLSVEGKIFTVFLIIFGFGALAYTAGRAAQYFFEQEYLWRRRMQKKIRDLKNHTVVCGFGRMGKEICNVLSSHDTPFVVIERDSDAINDLIEKEYAYIEGDAIDDEVLIRAEIKKATSLIAVLSSDAENVFVVLSARDLKPELNILARAESEASEKKLVKAGANKVILPYILGGRRIALTLIKPDIIDFIEVVASGSQFELTLEQIELSGRSELVNLELQKTFIRSDLDIIIVAIIRAEGKIEYNPKGNTTLKPHDKLMAIGKRKDLAILEELAKA